MSDSRVRAGRWQRLSSSAIGTVFLLAVVFVMLEGIRITPLVVASIAR